MNVFANPVLIEDHLLPVVQELRDGQLAAGIEYRIGAQAAGRPLEAVVSGIRDFFLHG